ncbi:MAG TPA: glycosyltransferase, partial [Tahibacter sp.]|nr:glycosyltransferase [Tahibacter sp.]
SLELDPSLGGSTIAIDLDGKFFTSAVVDANGRACVWFAFPPWGARNAAVMPRRGRDGEALAGEPLPLVFDGVSPDRLVPFGIDSSADEVAIVVPVYDAPALVERCLESVLAHTTGRARLIVIDDASPDPAIAPLLARYAERERVHLLRNERNRGFTATANRGIAAAGRDDVVLLNADTEVGPNWLTGLRRAAASAADVATATAVSDNAGAFSVPELERENAWPSAWTFEQAARALWHDAGTAYPALPTGNGFCMYIRRAALDAAGALDEAAFPHGYGEENDFCQRASARGFRHLVAGNVYVRHERSASFGHERRRTLGEAGMAVLRERWPDYERDVGATLFSYERRVLDWRVRRIFAAGKMPRPRVGVMTSMRARMATTDVDAWPLVEAIDDAGSHEALWCRLQSSAVDAIVADETAPDVLSQFAAALGIPFATAARGASIDDAANDALSRARSFSR